MDKELYAPEVLPALVLAWEEYEDMLVLRNQGNDIMDFTKTMALSVDSEGNMYGLRANPEGKLEWDLIVEVGQEGPTLTSIKYNPLK